VLKTYEKPLSEREPVVCIDEKPVVLHKDTRPSIPMQPGQVARRDYEYERCGTANVFCGIEPKAGIHFTKVTPTRASPEFAEFILDIAAHYPAAETIHLVMDNLSTHTRKALADRFGEVMAGWLWDRFAVHYTPKHGSWLNQAEIEIGIFSRQCLGKQRIGDISTLRCQAAAWNCRTNRDNIKIQWKFTRKLARRKLNYSFKRSRHYPAPKKLDSIKFLSFVRSIPISNAQLFISTPLARADFDGARSKFSTLTCATA
jgi:hypothetical protein